MKISFRKGKTRRRGRTSGGHPGTAVSIESKKDGRKKMKKIMQTLLLTIFVVLTTASFSYAEYAAAGGGNFPYFHLGCLIVGGLIILSLKNRYPRLYLSEAIGSFALYTVLVALFTSPVVDALKTLVG
jgi:FtsH-binding integral membrane protein